MGFVVVVVVVGIFVPDVRLWSLSVAKERNQTQETQIQAKIYLESNRG